MLSVSSALIVVLSLLVLPPASVGASDIACSPFCNMMCIIGESCACHNVTGGKTCCGCEKKKQPPPPPKTTCSGICPLIICKPIYTQPKKGLLPKCKPPCGSGPSNSTCTCCPNNCGCISHKPTKLQPPASPTKLRPPTPPKTCSGICPLIMCLPITKQPENGKPLPICKPPCGTGPSNSTCACCPTNCGCISPAPIDG